MLFETSMKPQGTFWFFSAVTLIGLLWGLFFLPETAGNGLEGMDELFSLPWWLIGRRGAAITADHGSVAEAYSGDDIGRTARIERREIVEIVEANDLPATH